MKIAFVAYDFPEYSICHVNEMTEAGEVLLLLPEQTSRAYLPELNPQVQFQAFHKPRLRQPLRQLATTWKLLSVLRAFRPDVIHFQNGHLYFNFALPLLRQFPLVTTIHDARQHVGDTESRNTPQWVMDFGFRQADQVIVHGRSMVHLVEQELGIAAHRIHVVPMVALVQSDASVPITDERQSSLFFGRIWEYKGLEYLIRAAPRVLAEFPQAKFVIAGRGEDLQRYRQMMHAPESFLVLNDWISDAQRSELFAGASMVVLPYIEASQSAVIPVAYAYEKPVVVTNMGGLPDMVDDGQTGRIVAPRDADGLAAAICDLLRDRERRMAMGRAGKQKLLEQCAPAVVAEQTLAVYRQAMEQRNGYRRNMPGVKGTERR